MIDFTKIFQLKGLKPKDKGLTNFYECCDLTKKIYLIPILYSIGMYFESKSVKVSHPLVPFSWFDVPQKGTQVLS